MIWFPAKHLLTQVIQLWRIYSTPLTWFALSQIRTHKSVPVSQLAKYSKQIANDLCLTACCACNHNETPCLSPPNSWKVKLVSRWVKPVLRWWQLSRSFLLFSQGPSSASASPAPLSLAGAPLTLSLFLSLTEPGHNQVAPSATGIFITYVPIPWQPSRY